MSEGFNHREERRIVPRWRTVTAAVRLGELTPLGRVEPRPARIDLKLEESRFEKARAEWRQHQRVGFAQDFLSAAVALDRREEALDAAAFILEHSNETSVHAARLAAQLLAPATSRPRLGLENLQTHVRQTAERGVRNSRQRVRALPRNAAAWVDLARHYTVLGHDKRAERAMRVALSLAPEARFALRAAARFYLHTEEADQALALLRRSSAIRSDPWLQAAEIAVSRVLGREAKYLGAGRRAALSAQLPSFHLSELAAAVGSMELIYGADKKARRLFEVALEDPTENAVAQAEWAARVFHGGVELRPENFERPNAYEAKAWEHYLAADWQESIHSCLAWLRDEPFSSRPTKFGSHVAAVGLEDYRLAAGFTELGLSANPDDPVLLNNLAFELASADEAERAKGVFGRITPELIRSASLSAEARSSLPVVLSATAGLIAFRLGDTDQGRAGYEQALQLARRQKNQWYEAGALLYFARERARLREADAAALLGEAEPLVRALRDETLTVLFKRVKSNVSGLTSTGSGLP